MNPTPYADLNDVLRDLVDGIGAALGDDLVGVCLQGSFAVGDADEHSDVDFVVATAGPLADGRVESLQALHGRVRDLPCPWAGHLEGSYFPREILRSCDRRGEDLWYLEHGDRSLTRSTHCNTAVVRQTVREHGVPLAGPDPASLVDPIPVGLLKAEILETMRTWGREIFDDPHPYRNRFYQGFLVLSYCRMWCDLATGKVGSKRRGAEWAKRRLSPGWADLIDRAWATRPDPATSVRAPADPGDFRRTLELVRLVVDRGGEEEQ